MPASVHGLFSQAKCTNPKGSNLILHIPLLDVVQNESTIHDKYLFEISDLGWACQCNDAYSILLGVCVACRAGLQLPLGSALL